MNEPLETGAGLEMVDGLRPFNMQTGAEGCRRLNHGSLQRFLKAHAAVY